MSNYHILKFNQSFLKDSIIYKPEYIKSAWTTNKVKIEDFLNEDALNWIKNLSIKPYYYANLFCGLPNRFTDIHIDQHVWAINFVWGSSQSSMLWYDITGPGISDKTTAGTGYTKWSQEQAKEIQSVNDFSHPMLVRTDIAHRVYNLSNDIRWCLSIRGFPEVSWNRIVKLLRPNFMVPTLGIEPSLRALQAHASTRLA